MTLNRSIVLAVYLLISFSLPVCSQAQEYSLGPDDALKITVYREEELEREVRVSSDGYISFPLLGKIKAEGLTVSELETRMTIGLKRYIKNPQVTVFIMEYSTITVTGQVEEPGSFPLKGELTVLEAIGLAGGFTKIASRNDVKIMRIENGKKKTIRVKVADISKRGDRTQDIPLKRGDVVFVPESFF
ncbi:polysaccharide biosynthesis/export family protein [Candidatus Omnitrophota bacterium]